MADFPNDTTASDWADYLYFAWQRGTLKSASLTVRSIVKDQTNLVAIDAVLKDRLRGTAAGRQCLVPAGDLTRQFNYLLDPDAPIVRRDVPFGGRG